MKQRRRRRLLPFAGVDDTRKERGFVWVSFPAAELILDLLRSGCEGCGLNGAHGKAQPLSPPSLPGSLRHRVLSSRCACLGLIGFSDTSPLHVPVTLCWGMRAASAAPASLPQSTCAYPPRGAIEITGLSWSLQGFKTAGSFHIARGS